MAVTAAELRAQEQLLSAALATGVGGEQRTVQRTLLGEARRAVAALDAGWEPFEPSSEWSWGYVEDPRFLHGRVRLASALLTLPLLVIGSWLAMTRWEPLATAMATLLLVLGLPVAIQGVLGSLAAERDKRWLEAEEELRVFNAPMPANAAHAYRRARESGLFDTFVVHSPRVADFRCVAASEAPSLGLLDPVLAGRIGRHSFLIAQWDLTHDLAALA